MVCSTNVSSFVDPTRNIEIEKKISIPSSIPISISSSISFPFFFFSKSFLQEPPWFFFRWLHAQLTRLLLSPSSLSVLFYFIAGGSPQCPEDYAAQDPAGR